ncbi:MAG: response regulator [Chitinophagaceae bacterium]|nr:MAG: response regulator [Chitinophagaceae bacterium]
MSLKNASVLVIDDDVDVLTAVRLLLKPEVKNIITEKNPEEIRHHLAKGAFDLILLDMNFNSSINTGNEGIYWLKKIKEEYRSGAARARWSGGPWPRAAFRGGARCARASP